jgi:proteasome assembly chaperone (PAC2) family protein
MIVARFEMIYPNSTLPSSKFINLICGFPGSDYAGKLAVDRLIHKLSAKNLVDIYSNTFPAQVLIKAEGIAILIRNAIFYRESTISSSLNMMFLTGDSQPSNPDAGTYWRKQFLESNLYFLSFPYMLW